MTNTFTVDNIRAAARRKYAPVEIEVGDDTTVTLKPLVRLGKQDRDAVVASIGEIKDLDDLEDEEDDELVDEYAALVCESIAKVFKLIASSPRKLIAALEDDDPRVQAELYTSVLSHWMGESQLGEAVPSSS